MHLVSVLLLASAGCSNGAIDAASQAAMESAARDYRVGDKVVLGSPRLTAGIAGQGPLRSAEIQVWLADPTNHQPLEFVLPAGLRDAADLVVIPPDNPLTRAKIELGRQLFFDIRLSRFDDFSCAACHRPEQDYSAATVMPEVERNPLPAINRLFSQHQFWDGRANSLEDQPASPIKNPFEMNTSPEACTARVAAIEGYRLQFEAIFGEVSFENICRALACFQRVLVTGPSPWDYHRELRRYDGRDVKQLSAEELSAYEYLRAGAAADPMSAAALRGEELFFSDRTGCSWCHSGPNLTDESFHNLGAGMDQPEPDWGRYGITKRDRDRGAFKTPTLRNVANTPPYMHNGQFKTLDQVVRWLVKGGYPNEHLSAELRPLDLSLHEQRDLVEFLRSLTGPLPPVQSGRLPE